MRMSSLDRIKIQGDLQDARGFYREIVLLTPQFQIDESVFDRDLQSGYDVSDGDGLGRTASWTVYRLKVTISRVDHGVKLWGRLAMQMEVGDLVIGVDHRNIQVIREAVTNEHAYISADGEYFRPIDIEVGGVGHVERYVVGCKKYDPKFRADGY